MTNEDIFDIVLAAGLVALLIAQMITNDSLNKRITKLEHHLNTQTITVSWRQHGDTLWVWDKVIIEAKP